MKKPEDYSYLWTSQKDKFVLVFLNPEELPSIIEKENVSMLLINEETGLLNNIIKRMQEAGAEEFDSWENFYLKYPRISPEERIRRAKNFTSRKTR